MMLLILYSGNKIVSTCFILLTEKIAFTYLVGKVNLFSNSCIYFPICLGGCPVYQELSKTIKITPCIREKYFIDFLFDLIYNENKKMAE